MTLIILLIVLLVERVSLQSATWQVTRYLTWYTNKYSKKIKANDQLSLLLFVVLPSVLIGILLFIFDSRLIDFIVSLFVLAVCIGHQPIRRYYRQYLNAIQRGDTEAASILHYKLMGEPVEDDCSGEGSETPEESIGETLIWLNLQYYAAPIFYFVVLGVPGVVLYSTILFLADSKFIGSLEDENNQATLVKWHEWVMWIPARLVSLGYMFVGHFGNGLEAWLKYSANLAKSSKFVVTKVALASEGLVNEDNNKSDKTESEAKEPQRLLNNAEVMVRLAKRNMVLFLVVVALLTLYGQIV